MRIVAFFVIGHHKVFIDCVLVAMLNVIDLVLGPSTIVCEGGTRNIFGRFHSKWRLTRVHY